MTLKFKSEFWWTSNRFSCHMRKLQGLQQPTSAHFSCTIVSVIPKVDLIESLGAALSIHMPKYTPAILSILNLFTLFIWAQKPKEIKEFVNAYVTGILFAAGLMLSGMTRLQAHLLYVLVTACILEHPRVQVIFF